MTKPLVRLKARHPTLTASYYKPSERGMGRAVPWREHCPQEMRSTPGRIVPDQPGLTVVLSNVSIKGTGLDPGYRGSGGA